MADYHGLVDELLLLNAMPPEAGDALAFNPCALHRGRYHTNKRRRTLMVTYTGASAPHFDYFSDQPWFLLPDYLNGVTPEARAFFQEFVDFYAPHWRAKLTDMLKYSSLLRSLAESGAPNPFFAE